MQWHEQPYPGGSPVKVKGFPRPLYPPDAKRYGKTHSSPGSDVVAYKRAISRLGRWPWQKFDETYHDDFAHGKPSHGVAHSGVAGFQTQQHIDATGWLGEHTFTDLLYARIPTGLPNAGQPALDSTCVALLNEAWAIYQGHETPPVKLSVRSAALKRAISQLGVVETPVNVQPYGQWYGMNGVPWCAIFCTWAYEHAAADLGKDSPSFVAGSRWSFVPYIVGDAYAGRYGLSAVSSTVLMPGDLVCFDWNWDDEFDHVGLFEAWIDGTTFSTIEGNTSNENNSNGGQVMRRQRVLGAQDTVFVRVAEP